MLRTTVLTALAILLLVSLVPAPAQAQQLIFQAPKLEPQDLPVSAATVTPTYDSASFRDPQYVMSFESLGSASSATVVVSLQVSTDNATWITPYGNDGNALAALTGSIANARNFGGAVATAKLSGWPWGRLHYDVSNAGYPITGITLYRQKH